MGIMVTLSATRGLPTDELYERSLLSAYANDTERNDYA